MRAGIKWLFALVMFVAIPAGCLTEGLAPQEEAQAPVLSGEEQPLEETQRCPGGLVDCCGDGTCTLPQVCKIIRCERAEPRPIVEASSCGEGFTNCCGSGLCMSLEACYHNECASDEEGPKALRHCPDDFVDCCGDGACIPVQACHSAPRDCPEPPPGLQVQRDRLRHDAIESTR